MSAELEKLIYDLERFGYFKAAERLADAHGVMKSRRELPDSIKGEREIRSEMKRLHALRRQYQLYAQSSPEAREEFDRMDALSGRYLSPKFAFQLSTIGRVIPDDTELQVFCSDERVPNGPSAWVQEVATLPTELRKQITRGLSSLLRGEYRTVGAFRSASDVKLLRVRGFGKEGIVFFEHVFGSNAETVK